uniref:Putative suppressor of g2 allele of skp1 n=1 Tax=Tabanus bromius TaxID=304241 RepID=A0A0K8TRE9_TABBR
MSARHDWYQSDSKVTVTVMLKNAAEKNCKVNIGESTISVSADDYSLGLELFRPIDAAKSTYKITPYKVEIVLAKSSAERWESLEKKKEVAPEPKKNFHDWDKLAKEITESDAKEAEGEEALERLFKKIYSDSSEEVKRAMNKSYSESGGTVLSTNWKDVGDKPVEVKPPDGIEFKKW